MTLMTSHHAANTQLGAPPQAPKTAAEVEREQEALLAKKYGALVRKQKLMPKEHKFFDSADWALAKQGVNPQDAAAAGLAETQRKLQPKTEPTRLPARRASHLGEGEEES